jgi:chaperone modulatory protein CbpM
MHVNVLTATPMDEGVLLDLHALTVACAEPEAWVMELVQVGILEPLPRPAAAPQAWRFPAQALFTARTVRRLQRDLGVNLEGAALALELMEQLQALQARLVRAGVDD